MCKIYSSYGSSAFTHLVDNGKFKCVRSYPNTIRHTLCYVKRSAPVQRYHCLAFLPSFLPLPLLLHLFRSLVPAAAERRREAITAHRPEPAQAAATAKVM